MRTIALSDMTLKTSGGLALSFKEKIELAKLLDRLNVTSIELAPIENRSEGGQKAPSAAEGSHEPHADGVFLAQKACQDAGSHRPADFRLPRKVCRR